MSNEKLELRHLAPYLPFGLEVNCLMGRFVCSGLYNRHGWDYIIFDGLTKSDDLLVNVKPLLRPLSDLTKEITHNGETFVPIEWLKENKNVELLNGVYPDGTKRVWNDRTMTTNIRFFEYCIVEKLIEWHFDIFGLIPKNLALPKE